MLAPSHPSSCFLLSSLRLTQLLDEKAHVDEHAGVDLQQRGMVVCAEVADLLRELGGTIAVHVHVPVSVTSGQRDTVHKVSALSWSFFMDAGLRGFRDYLKSFRSFCSDLGVEAGVPDFHLPQGPETMLPECIFNVGELQPDDELVRARDAAFGGPDGGEEDADMTFLPKALSFAGMQHVLQNLLKDANVQLSWWTDFHQQLKNVESFLALREYRDRFVQTCLLHRPGFQDLIHACRTWSATLYEKRWHEAILSEIETETCRKRCKAPPYKWWIMHLELGKLAVVMIIVIRQQLIIKEDILPDCQRNLRQLHFECGHPGFQECSPTHP